LVLKNSNNFFAISFTIVIVDSVFDQGRGYPPNIQDKEFWHEYGLYSWVREVHGKESPAYLPYCKGESGNCYPGEESPRPVFSPG
jgi:hypothetical protein